MHIQILVRPQTATEKYFMICGFLIGTLAVFQQHLAIIGSVDRVVRLVIPLGETAVFLHNHRLVLRVHVRALGVKMPELMSGFSEILKVSDFVSESMISVMKCSGIMAYQQGLLKEQLSILTANNVLPDMSKLMDRIYQTNKIITRDLQTKIEELQLVDDGSIASQDEYHEESNLEEISVPEEISIGDDDDGCLDQHSLPEIGDLLQMCQVSIDLQRRILSELQKKRTDWNLITSVMNLLLMVIQTVKAFF